MRYYLYSILAIFFCVVITYIYYIYQSPKPEFLNPSSRETIQITPKPTPLQKYSFDQLSQRKFKPKEIKSLPIEADKQLDVDEKFIKSKFYYTFEDKLISGIINVPKEVKKPKSPIIVMLRGYVDKEVYYSGLGTQHTAEQFAKAGYITFAPDFLGYGDSDETYLDVWEERFSRPAQILQLIASIKALNNIDPEKIGIWAHSNGGQLALSVLEISGGDYPTVLWAPVSKSFPYSILYFTDEFDDQGKYLRKEISRLEQDYDVRDFSITDYFDWIKAPIQLHQGVADDAVPVQWSRDLKKSLQDKDIDIEYFEYQGADHNLVGGWDKAVSRSIDFYNSQL